MTYTPTLTRFSVRYLLSIEAPSAVRADESAHDEALLRALELLDQMAEGGVPSKDVTVSLTCLEDLKVRR